MKANFALEQMQKRVNQKQGQRIRQYRKQKTLTQKQLSQKTGYSVYRIAQYEHGLKNLTVEAIETIAKSLGIPPTKLIGL